jgi:hypothetical protein
MQLNDTTPREQQKSIALRPLYNLYAAALAQLAPYGCGFSQIQETITRHVTFELESGLWQAELESEV